MVAIRQMPSTIKLENAMPLESVTNPQFSPATNAARITEQTMFRVVNTAICSR